MKEIFLLKLGEIVLKGSNKRQFEAKRPVTLCSRSGGMIPSPDQVLESIRQAQKGE